jgi:hypothetical protein
MTLENYKKFKEEVERRSKQYVISWIAGYDNCLVNGREATDDYCKKMFGYMLEVDLHEDYISICGDTCAKPNRPATPHYIEYDLEHMDIIINGIPKIKQLAAFWMAINRTHETN